MNRISSNKPNRGIGKKRHLAPRVLQTSADILTERISKLRQIVPEAFSEGKIDFEKLRATLGDIVDTRPDKYTFTWAGKRNAIQILQMPTRATLIPIKDESVDFDTTENIFIEGDNLEVMKLLNKSYFGKIRMIYIDPPYNTGQDFVYQDNYVDPLKTYLEITGQLDAKGNLLTTNPETSGRYHSSWLSMMYPRLFLSHQLLREDGVIFVSIDDNEVAHLRIMMNEIFGEENFLAELVWDLGTGTAAGHFTRAHEYILTYAKNKATLPNFQYVGKPETISERAIKKITKANPASRITFPAGIEFEGTDAVFEGEIGDREKIRIIGGKMIFKNGKLAQPVTLEAGWAMRNQIISWLERKETFDSKGQRVIRFYFDRKGRLQYEKERGFVNPQSVIRNIASTRKGSEEIEELFGEKLVEFPKPVELMRFLIELAAQEREIVLDFFAGYCTTAQAVLELNHKDGGKRRFLMIQLQEPTPQDSPARKAGFKTISDLGKERIRRVISRIKKERKRSKSHEDKTSGEDLGFKVFKLTESNYKPWIGVEERTPEKYAAEMESHIDPLIKDWKKENVIYEVAIKEGFPLTCKIQPESNCRENQIWRVTDVETARSFLICLDEKIKNSTIKSLDISKDEMFICRDIALDDSVAANLALQCILKTI